MADVARQGSEIVLKLSIGERIMAVHRDVRVPLSAVNSVDVIDGPIRRIQGLKPRNFKVWGGYWPGWFAYGSFFDGAVRQRLFAAVNGRKPRGLEIAGDTVRPRARSCSLSTPIVAPSRTTTSLSRMACSTTARRQTREFFKITARSTRDQLSTRAPGDRTEPRTSPPEMMTPLLTTLLIARPTRSPSSCTNLAGGWADTWVKIGHRSL